MKEPLEIRGAARPRGRGAQQSERGAEDHEEKQEDSRNAHDFGLDMVVRAYLSARAGQKGGRVSLMVKIWITRPKIDHMYA